MGTRRGRWLGSVGCVFACLFIASLFPSRSAAGETWPADLVFRDGFQGIAPFVTDLGAQGFQAPDSPVFDPGAAFTLEGWVYVTGDIPPLWNGAYIMGKGIPINGGGGGITRKFSLEIFSGRYDFETETYELSAPTLVAKRVWTHVAAVVDPSGARLYVNGVLVDSKTGVAPVPAAPTVRFGVGSPVDSDGKNIRGGYVPGVYTRQLRFWSVARTPAQLQAGMSQLRPTDATGLVANWPMDEGGGTVARDISGFGRPLEKLYASGAAHVAVVEDGPYFVPSLSNIAPGVMLDTRLVQKIDFDNDGDLDLFVGQIAPATYPATYRRQLAFRNIGGGKFVDATDAVLGTLMMILIRRTWVADFNGDGRADLFLAETGTDTDPFPGAQSRLLIQSADGRLVDETATRLPQHISYTHGLAIADIDGDGDLDILMGNIIRDYPRFYLNDGTGHFTDAPARLPPDLEFDNRHNSVAFCDVNGDHYPDLLMGGSYYPPGGDVTNVPNVLLMNDRSGHFIEDPAFTIPPKLHGKEGTTNDFACADLNGDGSNDLVLATDIGALTPGLQLLINDGAGHLTDASGQLNLTFGGTDVWVVEIHVADINADGKPDLVLMTGTGRPYENTWARSILLNRGDAVFVDASEALVTGVNYGMAVDDFDADGRIDVVVAEPFADRVNLLHNAKLPAIPLFDLPPACQLDHWFGATASGSVGTTLVVGGPGDAAPLPRYAGICSLRANAPGNYVTDDSPTNLQTFHARFYVLAASSGGPAVVFQARNAASAAMLTVRFSGTAFELASSNGAFAASQPITTGHWYAIELDWAAGAAPMMAVKGAGVVALPTVSASAGPASDRIDTALLGWLAGGTSGSIVVDAYESRRDTPPGRLCRGDADGNGLRDVRDVAAARSEFLTQKLAPAMPDCNEDGNVNSGDMVCLRNLQANAQGDCATFTNP